MHRIISIGHLEAKKRPLDAVEIVRKLRNKFDNIEFTWIGDGELKNDINEYIQKSDAKFVNFVGRKSEKEKWQLLKKSQIYISTSGFEGFNLTIAEAFLARLPVVAYALPVYREIYRDTIVYVPPFNTDLFAAMIEKLLREPYLAKKHAEDGRKLVLQEYSPNIVLDKIEKALEKVMANRK